MLGRKISLGSVLCREQATSGPKMSLVKKPSFLEHMVYESRMRKLCLFSLEKTKGNLTAVFNHLMRVCRKKGGRLFLKSAMKGQETKGTSYIWEILSVY